MILLGAPEAVLGGEQPDEACAAEVAEKAGGVLEPAVDRSLVGEKTYAPTVEELGPPMDEHFEAGLHAGHAADTSVATSPTQVTMPR